MKDSTSYTSESFSPPCKENYDENKNTAGRLSSFAQLLFTMVFILITAASCCATDATNPDEDLDIKIGQMLLIGFRGLAVDDNSPIIRDIRTRHIGGVVLFDYDVPLKSPVRNIQSPEQLSTLTAELQRASSIPLFIAVDQEGGRVNRLKEKIGFPPSVSAQYLGSADNPDVTRRYAEQTATTLSACGINLNFAPVVDLNTNPENPVIGKLERSFSANPEVVIEQARITIDAFHKYNVLAAIKHFPGHGSSTEDSHEGFTDVTSTWRPVEIIPFEAIIASGKCDMVMTAHIFNANIDPQWPATLSHKALTGILRNRLNYDGIIISDDMQMKAVSMLYDLETAIKMALLAGNDILIFANNSTFDEGITSRAVSIIKKLVSTGVISRKRIDESSLRIKKVKERMYPLS